MEIREQVLRMKEWEAQIEGLSSLEIFDKVRLLTGIYSVLVYSEEQIEIIWKMNNGVFSETEGGKKQFHCNKAM